MESKNPMDVLTGESPESVDEAVAVYFSVRQMIQDTLTLEQQETFRRIYHEVHRLIHPHPLEGSFVICLAGAALQANMLGEEAKEAGLPV